MVIAVRAHCNPLDIYIYIYTGVVYPGFTQIVLDIGMVQPTIWMNVKNNVGRIFLGIVNSSFPEGHALKPIFNRNTLKLSYSCMPNAKNAINAHNKAQLKKPAAEPPKNCSCRDKPNCPLNGECRAKSIVYQATVTTPRTGPNNTNNYHSETYVGLTDTEFKLRYANHKQSFSNQRLRNATELSKYIWSLKEKNIEYKITWKILGKAHSYQCLPPDGDRSLSPVDVDGQREWRHLVVANAFILQQNKVMQSLPAGKVPHNLPSRQSQPKQEVWTCQPLQTCWQIPAEKHLAQAQTPRPDRLGRTTLRSFSHYTSTDMSCSLQTTARWTLIVNCICLILHVCTCWNL